MKKFISWVCSILMILTAVVAFGCAPKNELDGYVLSICYDNGGYGRVWLDDAVEKFCEQEGVDIDKVYIEAVKDVSSQIERRLDTNKQMRDVMLVSGNGPEWAARGWLEPLDDVYSATLSNGKTVLESMTNQKAREHGHLKNSSGDHYYLFTGGSAGAWGIYYNKTMFEEKGWEVPKTYEELIALCDNIYENHCKGKPDNQKIYPFVCSSDIFNYWDFIVQNWVVQIMGIDAYYEYAKMASKDNYAMESVYSQAKVKALEYWSNIAIENATDKNGSPKYVNSQSSGYVTAQLLFSQGRVAMMPNGTWFENEVETASGHTIDIALMPTPYVKEAKKDANDEFIYVNYSGEVGGSFIPAAAKNKELAKKFLVFLAEEETGLNAFKESGWTFGFKADYSKVYDELSVCKKSIANAYENAITFGYQPETNFKYSGFAGFWMNGIPYDVMLSPNNTLDAEAYVRKESNWVLTEWDEMVRRTNEMLEQIK